MDFQIIVRFQAKETIIIVAVKNHNLGLFHKSFKNISPLQRLMMLSKVHLKTVTNTDKTMRKGVIALCFFSFVNSF